MTIYRNRLQDTEIDRDSLMYIGNEREGQKKRREREREEGRKDTDLKIELIEGVRDKGGQCQRNGRIKRE